MKKNMGKADRSIRILLAVVAVVLFATGLLEGTWAWVAGIATFLLVATSFVNWCPMYVAFGLSTAGKSKE